MKIVQVAVGVIRRADEVFICLRPDHQHQGGKWEFPGGKIDAGESVVDALRRELFEEVGITVNNCQPLIDITHDYGDKRVALLVREVTDFSGEPHGVEGQKHKWSQITSLKAEDFPAANVAILDVLKAS
ncbi:8-oxo-dGTP diphosphatase MutT [Alteromonas sp. ASW11-130]|uniref:8-oxo-dGTP diphosphatase MutT n=1 Tax=Alteromonas sp. ASW11-130 TaxID=3015775 RepID=UPI002242A1C1|nr:8-oxo-dGTP diphosphatase MutT [Alteromonas sp. ASW11-130]MCW8091618.1 8-oxo-dGTP diphosphatase MutT [Alteromonas sp. ASW11-130]